MIRNIDILFGRTAATYKLCDREKIRQSIREVSALQVLGIDKRISTIMFERGYLSKEQICAVMESLIHSRQIKQSQKLETYVFSDEDEENFHERLELPDKSSIYQSEMIELPEQVASDKLPLPPENLLLCINIKYSLQKNGFHVKLLNIIADKKLLTPQFKDIFPDIAQKKHSIYTPHQGDKKQMRSSTAILFSQILFANKKITQEQFDCAVGKWELITEMRIQLKFSELLYYLGYIERSTAIKAAASLANISKIDQYPRFPLLRLTPREQEFFERLLERGVFKVEIVEQASELLERLHQEGLHKIMLSDILILQGHLNRKLIAQKWAEIHKRDIVENVRQLQLDMTEESQITAEEMNKDLEKSLSETQEVLKQARQEIAEYDKQRVTKSDELEEADRFGQELNTAFRKSKRLQKRSLKQELQLFKNKLGSVDQHNAKSINTIIAYYRQTQNTVRLYLTATIIIIMMTLLGFAVALKDQFEQQPEIPENNTPVVETPEPQVKENPAPTTLSIAQIRKRIALAKTLANEYRFAEAIQIYKDLRQREEAVYFHRQLKRGLQNFFLQNILFQELADIVHGSNTPLRCFLPKYGEISIHQVVPEGVIVQIPGRGRREIPWKEIPVQKIYETLRTAGILKLYPWELALFCHKHKLVEAARESLAVYVERFPDNKEKAWELLAELTHNSQLASDYRVYQGKLYSIKEIAELKAQQIPVSKPKPMEKLVKCDWQLWDKQMQKMLRQRREHYSSEMRRKDALLRNGAWLSPELASYEQKISGKLQQGKVFFQGRWHSQKKLGKWHEIVLRKRSRRLHGFLRKQKNLYIFYSSRGLRYLTPKNVVQLTRKLSPWEIYQQFLEQLNAKDVTGLYALSNWVQNYLPAKLAKLQFARVLSLAPNFPMARHALGYIRHKKTWISLADFPPSARFVNFGNILVSPATLERFRLLSNNGKIVFIEEVALNKSSATNSEQQFLYITSESALSLQNLPPAIKKLWFKGRIHLFKKEYAAAQKCFSRVIVANPDFPLIWIDQALLKQKFRDLAGAYNDYSRALNLDPNLALAHLGHGRIHQLQRDYDEAEKRYLQALRLAPQSILPYYALVNLYLTVGRQRDAINIAKKSSTKAKIGKFLLSETRKSIQIQKQQKLQVTGPHYQIFSSADKIFAYGALVWLEKLYHRYNMIFSLPSLKQKFTVVLFSTRDDMQRYMHIENPNLLYGEIGTWWAARGELIIALDQHPQFWKNSLFACAVLQLLDTKKITLPPWLQEGLVKYFEEAPTTKGTIYWDKVPPYWHMTLQREIDQASSALGSLLTQTSQKFYSPRSSARNTLYSYAWIHFFFHGAQGEYLPLLKKYISQIELKKAWSSVKYEEIFSASRLRELAEAFNRYWQSMAQVYKAIDRK